MKKFLLLFMILTMCFSLLIIGCGNNDDDDDDGILDPPDQEDFDYFFSVMRLFGRDEYIIGIDYFQGDSITTAELFINGNQIPLEYNEWILSWIGYADLEVTTVYNFELSINESRESWDFNLATTAAPAIDWPDEYSPDQELLLDWVLEPDTDSMIQDLMGTSWVWDTQNEEYDIIDDVFVLLDSDVRSYDVPANWMSTGQEEYDFILAETNYFVTDTFLAIAAEVSGVTYGYASRREIDVNRLKEKIRERIK